MVHFFPQGTMACLVLKQDSFSPVEKNHARIVAGDQWSSISVPLAEHSPWTAPIMFFMMTTISLGVMNLILAVILGCSEDLGANPIMGTSSRLILDLPQNGTLWYSGLRIIHGLPPQVLFFWVERYGPDCHVFLVEHHGFPVDVLFEKMDLCRNLIQSSQYLTWITVEFLLNHG